MMDQVLSVIVNSEEMGNVTRRRNGRLRFSYADGWQSNPRAFPLSLSMPLVVADHDHATIEPWLWNLLPDNDQILARWAREFGVSRRSVFALLSHVGEDCAGAIQLIRPDRAAAVLGDSDEGLLTWQSEADVARRLRTLRQDNAAWRLGSDLGQFSLAGAQSKTALYFDGQRWAVPAGRMPTTHILKPPISGLGSHAQNEHLCLTLARKLGLPTARSEVKAFEDEIAIVITRYDRARDGDTWLRLHQEDFCQALGRSPDRKYESQGGPDVHAIAEAIRTHSSAPDDDLWTFVRALLLNWVIGGTDAHAKNYSMLIGAGGRARLAPLYDLASTLPYDFDARRLKLAMKVGGHYKLEDIQARHWARLASQVRLPADAVLREGRTIADSAPQNLIKLVDEARQQGLHHAVMDQMIETVAANADRCARVLDSPVT